MASPQPPHQGGGGMANQGYFAGQQPNQQRPMQSANPALSPRPGAPFASPGNLHSPGVPQPGQNQQNPGRPYPGGPQRPMMGMNPGAPRPPNGVGGPGLMPGQPQHQMQPDGRLSPRPGMPMQARPMPGQQQQQQQQSQQSGPAGIANQMANMQIGQTQQNQNVTSPPDRGQTPSQSRSNKRSARAYHQDEPAPPVPASGGWNDVPQQQHGQQQTSQGRIPQGQQPAWQQAAAARVAQYEQMQDDPNAALDQIPGQRNVISQEQARFNQAQMQAAAGGGHAQNIPIQPGVPGPQTPGVGPINQPPHTAGQRFPGPRTKIDPDQIPSPVEAMDNDQAFFDKEWFETCGRGGLPLSTTEFVSVDQGNCSPKHMRLTTYSMPASDELAATSQLPLAIIVQPFAQHRLEEASIPVVECGPSGPPRCKRCRGYINPWAIFVEGGQKWVCNLCGTPTPVAADYFCNLDMSGRRVDFEQRFELSRGTVEFKVPKEYWAVQSSPPAALALPALPAFTQAGTERLSPQPPQQNEEQFEGSTMGLSGQGGVAAKAATKAASDALGNLTLGQGRTAVRMPLPMTYFFLIDVSFSAVRCGALKASLDSIREVLYGPREPTQKENGATEEDDKAPGFGLPYGSRIAIMTFDRSLHFYNLLPELDHAQMLVVGDIDEPFVPLNEGLLADPWESRNVIETLLDGLPGIFAENMVAEAALGAAIRGMQGAMSTIGGQCNIFISTIPTVGPGSLKHREDTKLYGTEKEKQLFVPQDGFYRGVAEELVEAGIGVNTFFFPSQYIDVATIGTLSGLTGGELYFHPRFDVVRDRSRLDSQIKRAILRETGYNATMRVRCSNGLHVTDHFGNFFMRNSTDIELANIDADKAIIAAFKHDGKLDEKHEAHFQAATLYTTADGERRVRCHNIAVPVTSLLGNVFRYADLDSTITYLTKSAIALAQQKPLRDVRHQLTEKCVKILLAYRRNCASSTSPGQLILPESFKLLPLYILGINKTKALKGGNVTSDVRTFFMRFLRGLSTGATMGMLYPRMVALHNMRPDDGEPIQASSAGEGLPVQPPVLTGRIKTPPLMRPSYLRMEGHGAYLVENGEICLLWLGSNVSPKLLEDLYGVNSLEELDPRMTALPKLPTKLSQQARNLVNDFARQRNKPFLPIIVARQNRDGTEVELANSLVEDQNNDAMSYVDYLCHVHRIITTEMSGGGTNGKNNDGGDHSSYWRGW